VLSRSWQQGPDDKGTEEQGQNRAGTPPQVTGDTLDSQYSYRMPHLHTQRILERLAVFAAVASLLSCAWMICSNEIVEEVLAPDVPVKAVVFIRNCGATTGYSINVSVHPASSRLPNEAGDVFVATGRGPVIASWKSSRHLHIEYPPEAEVFWAAAKAAGIYVSYEPPIRPGI